MSENPVAIRRTGSGESKPEAPYVGLRPYERGEEAIFFGRGEDAKHLRNKIFSSSLTLLYAQSGVGKTSLLLTLTIPAIEEQGCHVVYSDHWEGPRPLTRLKRDIMRSLGVFDVNTLKATERSLVGLVRHLADLTSKPFVLVLDQFEQFMLQPKSRASALRNELVELVLANVDCHVVLSFREEFLGDLEAFREQILNLFNTTYRLEYLTEEQASVAITRPAELAGKTYEPALVVRLLADLKTDEVSREGIDSQTPRGINLSFLQIVCERLWKQACRSHDDQLTLDVYENKLKGTSGILRTYMDETAKRLGPLARLRAAKILSFLAPPSGLKMAFSLADLSNHTKLSESRLKPTLRYLMEGRIITDRSSGRIRRYELFHDGLIKVVTPWSRKYLDRVRKYRWTALVGGIVAIALVLCRTAFWWVGYMRSTGEINRLMRMGSEEQSKEATAIINNVGVYLWNKNDNQSFSEFVGDLRKCKDVITSSYDVPPKARRSQLASRHAAPVGRSWEEGWPLVLLYNPSRVLDLEQFRRLWTERALELTQSLGVPVLQNIKLETDSALRQESMLLRAFGESSPMTSSGAVRTRELLSEQTLQVPAVEQDEILVSDRQLPGRLAAFFGENKLYWRAVKEEWQALDVRDEGSWWLVPRWTLPLWKVAQHDPETVEELLVRIVADQLLATPELIVTPEAVEYLLLKRSESQKTVEEAIAAQGGLSRIRSVFIELIRNKDSLNDLDQVLELLAKYPRASMSLEQVSLQVHKELSSHVDVLPVELQGRSMVALSPEVEEWLAVRRNGLPEDVQRRYTDVAQKLSPQSKGFSVLVGSAISRFLAPNGARIDPAFVRAEFRMRDRLYTRFGTQFSRPRFYDWSSDLSPQKLVIESTTWQKLVTLPPSSDEWLTTIIQEIENAYIVDRCNLLSLEDVHGLVSELPPALYDWLTQRYTFTDLKTILRATLSFRTDDRNRADKEGSSYLPPPENTISHLSWLLASLSFWSNTSNLLDTRQIAQNLQCTTTARLQPSDVGPADDATKKLISSGVTALATYEMDRAAAIFKQATVSCQDPATKAFLALYGRQALATQRQWLAQLAVLPSPGHAAEWEPQRAVRLQLEDLLADGSLPIDDDFSLRARVFLILDYALQGEKDKAEKIRLEISDRDWLQKATPEELYFLAFELFDSTPSAFQVASSFALHAFQSLPEAEAKAAYNELLGKSFANLPAVRHTLLEIALRPTSSCWLAIYLAQFLTNGYSVDDERSTLALCQEARSRIYHLSEADQKCANAAIDFTKASAFIRLCSYGEKDQVKDAQELLRHLLDIVDPASRDPWPSRTDIYKKLSYADLWGDDISAAIETIRNGRREFPVNSELVREEFLLYVQQGNLGEASRDAQEGLKIAWGSDTGSSAENGALYDEFILHWLLDDDKFEYYARRCLAAELDLDPADYLRLIFYCSLRRQHKDDEAKKLLEDRWANIDESKWDDRMRNGDTKVWLEMLTGYYIGQVSRENIFDLVNNWENSKLRAIGKPRLCLLCQAYFYDALLRDANGDYPERSQFNGALQKVVETGQCNYLEYDLARCLLQQPK